MKIKNKLIAALFATVNLSASMVFAESIYLPSLNAQLDSVSEIKSNSSNSKLKNKVKFSGYLKSFGRFSGVFDTQNNSIKGLDLEKNNMRFLQGRVSKRNNKNKTFPAVGTVMNDSNGDQKLRLFVVLDKRKSGNSKLIEINFDFANKNKFSEITKINYARGTRYTSLNRGCINTGPGHTANNFVASQDIGTSNVYNYYKMLVEADVEYAAKTPDAFQEIATEVNGVDTIYKRDLGLALDITVVPEAQSYSSQINVDQNFTFPIHAEMVQRRPSASRDADVHYLYSGKDPVGADVQNLAGAVPDIGALCKNPDLSVGFTIRIESAFDLLTTAHEMGHLLGGEHDDAQTGSANPGIMNSGTAATEGEITKFSNFSKNQIGAYVSENGSCLVSKDDGQTGGGGESGGTVPPEVEDFVISAYKEGKFFGVFVGDGDTGLEGVAVSVYYRKNNKTEFAITKSGTSDEEGYFDFKPRKNGQYKFEAYGEFSNTLKKKK